MTDLITRKSPNLHGRCRSVRQLQKCVSVPFNTTGLVGGCVPTAPREQTYSSRLLTLADIWFCYEINDQ